MNKGFVPMGAPGGGPPAEGGARSKAGASPAATKAFQAASAAGSSAQTVCAAGGEPKITLEREGDRVTRIHIQCCCGHIIELACSY